MSKANINYQPEEEENTIVLPSQAAANASSADVGPFQFHLCVETNLNHILLFVAKNSDRVQRGGPGTVTSKPFFQKLKQTRHFFIRTQKVMATDLSSLFDFIYFLFALLVIQS